MLASMINTDLCSCGLQVCNMTVSLLVGHDCPLAAPICSRKHHRLSSARGVRALHNLLSTSVSCHCLKLDVGSDRCRAHVPLTAPQYLLQDVEKGQYPHGGDDQLQTAHLAPMLRGSGVGFVRKGFVTPREMPAKPRQQCVPTPRLCSQYLTDPAARQELFCQLRPM